MMIHNKISAIANGSDPNLIIKSDWNEGHVFPKVASDNLRNSHDAEAITDSATYVKLKTITLNQKLYGTVRVKFDLKTQWVFSSVAYGRIYHNGVALGTIQSEGTQDYVTKSEDITHDFEKNDTIELWGRNSAYITYVQNFRLYYDNEDITTVSATNS